MVAAIDSQIEIWCQGGGAYLTIYHSNTVIGYLEPNFATQTNDEADVIL